MRRKTQVAGLTFKTPDCLKLTASAWPYLPIRQREPQAPLPPLPLVVEYGLVVGLRELRRGWVYFPQHLCHLTTTERLRATPPLPFRAAPVQVPSVLGPHTHSSCLGTRTTLNFGETTRFLSVVSFLSRTYVFAPHEWI